MEIKQPRLCNYIYFFVGISDSKYKDPKIAESRQIRSSL